MGQPLEIKCEKITMDITLPQSDWERIEEICEREGITLDEFCDLALRNYLDEVESGNLQ